MNSEYKPTPMHRWLAFEPSPKVRGSPQAQKNKDNKKLLKPYLILFLLSEIKQVNVRMPHSSKKQLKKQVEAHIKKYVSQSAAQIMSEINDNIEKY